MAYPDGRTNENRLVPTGDDYKGVVSKGAHQGMTFQHCLLAQFAVRALRLEYEDMTLGTEVEGVGKFDDIVFSYKDTEGKRRLQLLQAKYAKEDGNRELEARELLNYRNRRSQNGFYLPEYFRSYEDLKRNSDLMTPNVELESLIMCSNKYFVFKESVRNFSLSKGIFETSETHSLLNNALLKFKCDFENKDSAIHLVVVTLKNAIMTIPAYFAKKVLGRGQKYTIPEFIDSEYYGRGLYYSYVKALKEEVVDRSAKKFKKDFINGSSLSSIASHYWRELWFGYGKKYKSDENDFKSFLREKTIEVNGGDYFQLDNDTSVISESGDSLDSDVREFLSVLTFSMNQPNIEKMEGYTKEEMLQLNKKLTKSSVDTRYAVLFKEIVSWAQSSEGKYLTGEDLRKFLFSKDDFLSFKEMEDFVLLKGMCYLNKTMTRTRVNDTYNSFESCAESAQGKYHTGEDLKKSLFSDCLSFNLQDPVTDFSGREASLVEIHRKLNNDSGNSTNVPRALVLFGLGGMGKTELARKYSQMHHKSHYSYTIWLESQTIERLQDSFSTLAFQGLRLNEETSEGERKDMKVIVEETYDYFNMKRSLFVFDNAEKMEEIRDYFPRFGNDESIYVIITSRTGNWNGFEIINLDNFTPDESFRFINMSIGELHIFDEHEASELASKLSHFPLAIKQAVSYIKEQNKLSNNIGKSFRISSYLALLKTKSEQLLDKTFEKEIQNNYTLTALKTMNIAVEYVLKSDNPTVPIKILNIMSFLSPENIQTDVMNVALDMFTDDEVSLAFVLLSKLAIISIKESKARIHRLIQLVNRIRLKNKEDEDVIRQCFRVAETMDVEHLISVWEYATQYDTIVNEYGDIPRRISNILENIFQPDVCLDFENKAKVHLSRVFGNKSIEVLKCKERVANYEFISGNYKVCAEMRSENILNRKRICGDKNEDYVWELLRYALTLDETEEVQKIINEILGILDSIPESDSGYKIRVKRWLVGELKDDPGKEAIVREYRNEVNSNYESLIQRYYEECAKMRRESLSIRKKICGDKNEDYLWELYLYADTLDDMGETEEVQKTINEILEILNSIPGSDSELMIRVKRWLVRKLKNDPGKEPIVRKYRNEVNSNYESLIQRYEDTVERVSDPNDMKQAVLLNEKKTKEEKFEELKKQKMGIFGGVDVDDVIKAYYDLAYLKSNEGKFDECYQILKKSRDVLVKHFGEKYYFYNNICCNIALSLFRQGKYERSLYLSRDEKTRLENEGGDLEYLKRYEELIRYNLEAIKKKKK